MAPFNEEIYVEMGCGGVYGDDRMTEFV